MLYNDVMNPEIRGQMLHPLAEVVEDYTKIVELGKSLNPERYEILEQNYQEIESWTASFGAGSEDIVDFFMQSSTEDVVNKLVTANALVRGIDPEDHSIDGTGGVAGMFPSIQQERTSDFSKGLRFIQMYLGGAGNKDVIQNTLQVVLPKLVNYMHMFKDGNGRVSRLVERVLTPEEERYPLEVIMASSMIGCSLRWQTTHELYKQTFSDEEQSRVTLEMYRTQQGPDMSFFGKIYDALISHRPDEEQITLIRNLDPVGDELALKFRHDYSDTHSALKALRSKKEINSWLQPEEYANDLYDLDKLIKIYSESEDFRVKFKEEYNKQKSLRTIILVKNALINSLRV